MPRDLPLGNGQLAVTFDSTYSLCDIYFPHVGTENHAYRNHSKLGVWVDGQFGWLNDADWQRSLRYAEDSLITRVEAVNARLGLRLIIEDAVDFDQNVLLRRFTVRTTLDRPVEIRLFMHLDIAVGGNTVGDTAFYHPGHRALVAYKNRHYLLLAGRTEARISLDGWTTAQKGAWLDAEDGQLDGISLAFGSVDCVGELRLGMVAPDTQAVAHAWLAVGSSLEEVGNLHALVLERTPELLIERTHSYWRAWVQKDADTHQGFSELPAPIQALYRRSLLLMMAHTDREGAIIASSDSEITAPYSPFGSSIGPITDVFQGHENYAYSWPRDGSLVAMALDNAGNASEARSYLAFCERTMTVTRKGTREHAYMLQKFISNGAVASNVIPWVDHHGQPRLPIQEDETALVLIALRNHYERTRDWGFLSPIYRRMIVGMANFLVDFRDPATGLPLASQDLWEERQGIHAFSVATVWRALRDAAFFSDLFAEPALTKSYLDAAAELKSATARHLYDETTGRFARSMSMEDEGSISRDMIVDASLFALSYFGMFEPDDPRIVSTMTAVEDRLAVPGEYGGIARFEGDTYQLRQSALDLGVPGNPWFICTLWLAQYQLQRARVLADLEEPLRVLSSVEQRALPSGVLAEQIDPVTGEPAGATPLTWTHATVILTVLEYLEAKRRIEADGKG
jgi:GH15 family glucan-1,4-alpha-glucosidase